MAARSQSHRCSEFYSDRRATSPLSIGFPSKNKYLGHLRLPHWYQAGIKHEHGAWHIRKKVPKALEAATTRRAARLLVETNAGYQGSKC